MNLKNQLLISMPSLDDSWFAQSVIYLFEHTDQGASGIVINSPTDMTLDQVLEQLNLPAPLSSKQQQVMRGGPVESNRGFILHRGEACYEDSIAPGDGIALTTSKDLLEQLSIEKGPEQILLALGYAGWSSGQLEQEVIDNSWLTAPLDLNIVFDLPIEKRWQAALSLLGVAPLQLSPQAGHS